MIRIKNITLTIDERQEIANNELLFNNNSLLSFISRKLKVEEKDIQSYKIIKESIDARKIPTFIITIDICLKNIKLENRLLKRFKNASFVSDSQNDVFTVGKNINQKLSPPVIIGMGPAGIFAALEFLEKSITPIIVEQGSSIDDRIKDVEQFIKDKNLNCYSNIQFGEGGAGTFSDAKISTGVSSPTISKILNTFVKFGAPESIVYKSMPHIGTDIIRIVIKNIRNFLIENDVKIYFNTKFVNFNADNNGIQSVVLVNTKNNKEITLSCNNVLLCIGHSSRDTIEMLYNKGVLMLQKPFAVGVRIEHLQENVNKSRYHNYYKNNILGAATYNLNVHTPDRRGVYTFCMCPGGEVVLACSEKEKIVVNGMSYYKRNNPNANSAILVGIKPEDFKSDNPLAGIEFQRKIEKSAFNLVGSKYIAPVQTVGCLLSKSKNIINSVIPSCKNGYELVDLKNCLPEYIISNIQYALPLFAKKMDCFESYDAILTGVETRSSSPVRIVRDENFMCTIKGLYGAGEGSGYSGGIMSSALDGIKVANKICENEYGY